MGQGYRTRKLEATFARRRRLLVVVALCVWGAIWARAVHLQVINRTTLSDVAERQSDRRVRLVAPRGEILDARGHLLAKTVGTESFFAYPNRESSARQLALKFAPVLHANASRLRSHWEKRDDRFTWMARRCDAATADRIRSWELPGVHATSEFNREYPCSIPGVTDPVGFVNADLDGGAGLELQYDDCLKGIDGEGVLIADATGRRFDLDPIPIRPQQPGTSLHLSLDWNWQSILAEELVSAVDKWKARGGEALLMNPHTGEIVAMVSYDPAGASTHTVKCRLVSDVFEPGSTFKLVTFAGALSDGVVGLNNFFDCGNGKGEFSGHILHDDKRHGILSAAEVLIVSSNVGTGRVANCLEPGRLEFWARRFGFGSQTGIDLQGESNGRIAQQRHSEFNVATLSIGHGVAVTMLQLATAYAAVANGGYLVRPHLVAAKEDPNGRMTTTPLRSERILRPEVALVLKNLMRRVVTEGTATTIWDPRYPIGGKTGTAEKPDPRTGRYDKSRYIASFVGFYPADKPRLLGLVMIDEPQPIHYGGYTAAPVLLSTIRRGERMDRYDHDSDSPWDGPVAAGGRDDDWARRLVNAVAPIISIPEAQANAELADDAVLTLVDKSEPVSAEKCETVWDRVNSTRQAGASIDADEIESWPDLTGLNLRDALTVARQLCADIRISGSGLVSVQTPAAGAPVNTKEPCRLTLQ